MTQPSLRAIRPEDYPVLTALRQDAELQRLLLGATEPSAEPVESWVGRRQRDGWIAAVTDDRDQCIGYVQISAIHHANQSGWFGICLVPDARGQGIGGAALSLTQAHAKRDMGLRKLSLHVRTDNPASGLYLRHGFREVGILEDEYFDGTAFHDVRQMECLLTDTGWS